jgi:4-hydroxy-4-methyl-2-oxoglutarate aldolase
MTKKGTHMSDKMNVDRLQAERDTVEQIELSIPEAEICERFEKLYTGAVNDVMRELCMPLQALPPSIVPLRDEMVLAGFAFTIRSSDNPTMGGELELRVKMLDEIKPNHVCVWNANGRDIASHWGGVMTRASLKRGARGAIVDGGIRDTKDILEQGFPIWYRYRTSTGALSHCKLEGWQEPIYVGNVVITKARSRNGSTPASAPPTSTNAAGTSKQSLSAYGLVMRPPPVNDARATSGLHDETRKSL